MSLAGPAPITIPRSFTYDGVAAVIENGVARDILKAGMADLRIAANPADEAFVLSEQQVQRLVGLAGTRLLAERGLL